MKIFAGLKFQRRNPEAAPRTAAARVVTKVWPLKYASIAKKTEAIAATPAHNPSM
jgi:hypothetical protein